MGDLTCLHRRFLGADAIPRKRLRRPSAVPLFLLSTVRRSFARNIEHRQADICHCCLRKRERLITRVVVAPLAAHYAVHRRVALGEKS